jgi:putative tryptophan/tyrosine transport system substrate-binding protein
VFATGADQVKVGLVSSLNRPGGNLTGISFYNNADLLSKQLQFLRDVVPSIAMIGLL